jgi:hypothetical protein
MPYVPPDYLAIYEQEGLELQSKILGNLLGFYTSEIGELNALIHLWGYDSFEDRTRRRAALAAEPAWGSFLAKVRPMLQAMSNRLLIPTAFSPGIKA